VGNTVVLRTCNSSRRNNQEDGGYIFLRRQLVKESILSKFAFLNLRPSYSLGSEQKYRTISRLSNVLQRCDREYNLSTEWT